MRTNQNSFETVTNRLSAGVGSSGRPVTYKLPVRFLEIRPALQVTQRKLCARPVTAKDPMGGFWETTTLAVLWGCGLLAILMAIFV
jgi:hypothetical protein